jgi:hypothetical protein
MTVALGATEVAGLLERADPDHTALICGERSTS